MPRRIAETVDSDGLGHLFHVTLIDRIISRKWEPFTRFFRVKDKCVLCWQRGYQPWIGRKYVRDFLDSHNHNGSHRRWLRWVAVTEK